MAKTSINIPWEVWAIGGVATAAIIPAGNGKSILQNVIDGLSSSVLGGAVDSVGNAVSAVTQPVQQAVTDAANAVMSAQTQTNAQVAAVPSLQNQVASNNVLAGIPAGMEQMPTIQTIKNIKAVPSATVGTAVGVALSVKGFPTSINTPKVVNAALNNVYGSGSAIASFPLSGQVAAVPNAAHPANFSSITGASLYVAPPVYSPAGVYSRLYGGR